MSTTRIEIDAETLQQINSELGRPARELPFETAAECGLSFSGGFDHASIHAQGWGLKLHDRGCNDRENSFLFAVPVADRTSRRGPLA
jgi:hypothetical protein